MVPDQIHQIPGECFVVSRDPSECIFACSQTASNHPAKDAALVGTLIAAKVVRLAEALMPDSAVSGVWAAVVEVAAVAIVVKVVAAVW